MLIDFPGGARVDAHFDGLTLETDQPPEGGGEGSAPTPFATFLASVGTCAGIYVLGFCRRRGIPTRNIRLLQHMDRDQETGLIARIRIEVQLPPDFPEHYRPAVIRAADQCAVKKHFERPPAIEVTATTVG
jgi:putative redox protein